MDGQQKMITWMVADICIVLLLLISSITYHRTVTKLAFISEGYEQVTLPGHAYPKWQKGGSR